MVTIRKARQDDAEILTEIGMRAWRKAMASVGEATEMAANARDAFARFTYCPAPPSRAAIPVR